MSDSSDKIECRWCGSMHHMIQKHIKADHPDRTLEQYQAEFPDAPMLSPTALQVAAEHRAKLAASAAPAAGAVIEYAGGFTSSKVPLHELFGFGPIKAAMGHKGNAIPITKVNAPEELAMFAPRRDPNYIFNIELLRSVMLAIEMNIPAYTWGHAGTGKSTLWEQIAAITGRPLIRVQHTRNMEESHVVGQTLVKDGATHFELGPLAFAMKHGLIYLADEYDFAMPAVLAVYQPVLEGKALVIKEADRENRVIEPHPLFRFVATGNTNGTGDDTGLYQGTLIQNAANYERFGIVEEIHYMAPEMETGVVSGQGGIPKKSAELLVRFAGMIRESFSDGKIGLPISPRALINAAKIGLRRGSQLKGLEVSYLNRLSRTDKEAAREVLTRLGIS